MGEEMKRRWKKINPENTQEALQDCTEHRCGIFPVLWGKETLGSPFQQLHGVNCTKFTLLGCR